MLGAIESGVDFEKRIATIYQTCRQADEIKAAFDQLQRDLSPEISESMTQTRRKLLENFDDEVREKLRICEASAKVFLGKHERLLMQLTMHELSESAHFIDAAAFTLHDSPFAGDIPVGRYELPRRSREAHLYRLGHPLADGVIAKAKSRDVPPAEITFSYGDHAGIISALKPFIGQSGWIGAYLTSIESCGQVEDHLVLAAFDDEGTALEHDASSRLFTLPGKITGDASPSAAIQVSLDALAEQHLEAVRRTISERNSRLLDAESSKLDAWSDDLKLNLQLGLDELDRAIKTAEHEATTATVLESRFAARKRSRSLLAARQKKRDSNITEKERIDRERHARIATIEARLPHKCQSHRLFLVRWSLIA